MSNYIAAQTALEDAGCMSWILDRQTGSCARGHPRQVRAVVSLPRCFQWYMRPDLHFKLFQVKPNQ